MNTEIELKYELLPIIDLDIDSDDFFFVNGDVSESKIKELMLKNIVYDVKEGNIRNLQLGKLLEFKDNQLKVKLDEDFEDSRTINLSDIAGIEECFDPSIEYKSEYNYQLCEITNKTNQKLTVLIKYYDGVEITFDFKIKKDNILYINEYIYPLFLLKNIEVVK